MKSMTQEKDDLESVIRGTVFIQILLSVRFGSRGKKSLVCFVDVLRKIMKKEKTPQVSRRDFIERLSYAVVGTTVLGASDLALVGCGSTKQEEKTAQESAKPDASGAVEKSAKENTTLPEPGAPEKSPEDAGTPEKAVVQESTTPEGTREPTPEIPHETKECTTKTPTEKNIEGPYYCKEAPWRTQIAEAKEPGQRMVISGVVYNTSCQPLANAIVEIWQADTKGAYYNSCQTKPGESAYRLRGRMKTNDKGEYSYETIMPGRYLNGETYRPAHIHYKVGAAGYKLLTTQLYFQGDPYNKVDAFIRPSLVIPLQKGKALWKGSFDVTLTS